MNMDKKRMEAVCFSGHRNVITNLTLQMALELRVRLRVEHGGGDFYAGGAMGWDAICSKTVLDLKKRGLDVRLHIILPCCFEEYTQKWNDTDKQELMSIMSRSETVEYISEHYTKDCMKRRNQKLVDSAGWLWCFYDEKRSRSGTGQTVRMAEKLGLRIRNLNI